uniref:Tudor domain-containing protein n=1 Tax=Syphacia muris TaxID=451379 RepID=A0A0N5ABK9_9BILA
MVNVDMDQSTNELTKVPLTIFDQDPDGTLDVSEEMEEIRELFYDLIKSKFPTGVTVEHLEKVYKENYEQNKSGPTLPFNWLEHIRVADEFEVVNRGPIVMVYTRQRNAPSIQIDSENSLKITKGTVLSERKVLRIRLTDKELAQQVHSLTVLILQCMESFYYIEYSFHMKTIPELEPLKCPSIQPVVIVHCDDAISIVVVHLASKRSIFLELQKSLHSFYEEKNLGEYVLEPVVGGIYAVKNNDQLWYRVVHSVHFLFQALKNDMACCLLVDFGKEIMVPKTNLRRMRADFVFPRKYPILAIETHVGNDEDFKMCTETLRPIPDAADIVQLRFVAFNGVNRLYSAQWIGLQKNSGGTPLCNKSLITNTGSVNAQKLQSPAEKVVLLPMDLTEMSKTKFTSHILSVLDAENISFRQCTLDPIPDYISSAVQRDSLSQLLPPSDEDLVEGNFFTVYMNSKWERVLLLGRSHIDDTCYRIYAVDLGIFSVAKKHLFRYILLPKSLHKIMMAKCKVSKVFHVDGIKPVDGSEVWSRDCQKILSDVLFGAKNVEIDPVSGWSAYKDSSVPSVPFTSARIFADGVNIAEMLVERGLAVFV